MKVFEINSKASIPGHIVSSRLGAAWEAERHMTPLWPDTNISSMTFTNSLIKDDPTDVSMGVFILNCDFTVYNLLDLEDMATSSDLCGYLHLHAHTCQQHQSSCFPYLIQFVDFSANAKLFQSYFKKIKETDGEINIFTYY